MKSVGLLFIIIKTGFISPNKIALLSYGDNSRMRAFSHFRSRDKDDGHSISRFRIPQVTHANLMALCFIIYLFIYLFIMHISSKHNKNTHVDIQINIIEPDVHSTFSIAGIGNRNFRPFSF